MHVAAILKDKGNRVVHATPGSKMADAAATLQREHIGVIVVSDRAGAVDGILSERDIVHAVATHGTTCLDGPVRDYMTANVITCTPDDTLDKLMQLMTDHRIRHLPVMRNDRMVGIISIGDVVKHRLGELQHERDALEQYIAAG